MCGIAGFLGSFDRELVRTMTSRIAHRGPDDSGVFHSQEDRIGLGHRRLSIIDLSAAGKQPMWDFDEKVAIVFNGEIYNYREIRESLQARNRQFHSQTDTEVLLALYREYGVEMLSHLNGMYAFAIWDSEKKDLFLARDGFGVKPLYYAWTREGFVFASELKSILACPNLQRELDTVALRNYLIYLWSPGERTPLKAVKKMRPGQAMVVQGGANREIKMVRSWEHYRLPVCTQSETQYTDEDAAGRLAKHLRTAVERQLVADVDVGAFLSGGLDSSSLVAMATQIDPKKKIECFTIGFLDEPNHDLPYAERVASHLGVPLNRIDVGAEVANDFELMVYHLDEPQADVAPLFVRMICKLAREKGIKVLLSGAGGDDIFGGYRRHYAVQSERYWSWLPVPARRAMQGLARRMPVSNPPLRKIAKAFQFAGQMPAERLISYFWWCRPDIVEGLFRAEFQEEFLQEASSFPLSSAVSDLPNDATRLQRMIHLDQRFFLPDHNLNYTDKMSMEQSIEVRVPFLDPDLADFAASIPDHAKQNGKVGKWLFKKAMEPYLPRDVIYRPKVGFAGPLRKWLRNQLKPLVDECLSPSSLEDSVFDPAAVRRLIEADRVGRVDASYTILSLLCTQIWCRRFLNS